jgi:hypothetical protein
VTGQREARPASAPASGMPAAPASASSLSSHA